MAGAECQRRLDLDAELVGRHTQPVVAAVHDELAGADRDQICKARLDPVPGLDRVERDRPRHLRPGRIADQPADPRLVGWFGEMHGDIPAPVRPLERGDRGLALEKTLGEPIDHPFCGRFAADRECRAVGAGGGGRGHHGLGCLARLRAGGSRAGGDVASPPQLYPVVSQFEIWTRVVQLSCATPAHDVPSGRIAIQVSTNLPSSIR